MHTLTTEESKQCLEALAVHLLSKHIRNQLGEEVEIVSETQEEREDL